MAEEDLDALVVRAPDNVLYLTNYWGMKGYDVVVFPREGDPTLLVPRAAAERRRAHGLDGRRPPLPGYDERDPRPPHGALARARPGRSCARQGTSGSGSSSRSARRPPTAWSASRPTFTHASFARVWPGGVDATPLLAEARARQDGAGDRADAARERARRRARWSTSARELRPGMKESEAGALWEGFVHGEGTGWQGQVELARGFSLVWSGPGIRTFTATGDRPVAGARADAVRDLGLRRRLLVRPHEERLPGRARRPSTSGCSRACSRSTRGAIDHCRRARAWPSSTA